MSLLTDQEIHTLFRANCVDYPGNYEVTPGQSQRIARAIEAAVIEKVKARRVGHWNGDCTFPVFLTSTKGTDYCNVPLYRLPEGD